MNTQPTPAPAPQAHHKSDKELIALMTMIIGGSTIIGVILSSVFALSAPLAIILCVIFAIGGIILAAIAGALYILSEG
mgnify:CR=1 FL=1